MKRETRDIKKAERFTRNRVAVIGNGTRATRRYVTLRDATERKRREPKEAEKAEKRERVVSFELDTGQSFRAGRRAQRECACACRCACISSTHTHVPSVLNYAACIFSGLFGGSQSLAGNPASLRAHRVTRLQEARKTRENFSISQQAASARDLAERREKESESGVKEIRRVVKKRERKGKNHPRVGATRNRK